MKIIAAARHPGPAEALGPVVAELRRLGHEVLLIGVRGDTQTTRLHGGSANIFEQQLLPHVELVNSGYTGDIVNVPAQFADRLIDSFRPDRIIVGCSMDSTGEVMCIEGILIAAGEKHSIRTLQISDMWNVWFPRKAPTYASAYAVIDEFDKAVMVARGAPPCRIVVTGNPGLDMYAEAKVTQRSERRRELGLKDERVLVYFGGGRSPNDPSTLRWVIEAMRETDRLIFARHPRDPQDYEGVLALAGQRLIRSTWKADKLVSVADVCFTHYSTMGLKAALLDLPVISLLLDNDVPELRAICGGFPLSLIGGSIEANASREVQDLLSVELVGNATKVKAALHIDGQSAARIAQLVLSE